LNDIIKFISFLNSKNLIYKKNTIKINIYRIIKKKKKKKKKNKKKNIKKKKIQ